LTRTLNVGVFGAGQLRLKFGDPRDERLDPARPVRDQGVFLGNQAAVSPKA